MPCKYNTVFADIILISVLDIANKSAILNEPTRYQMISSNRTTYHETKCIDIEVAIPATY